jgi:hypothetical protein
MFKPFFESLEIDSEPFQELIKKAIEGADPLGKLPSVTTGGKKPPLSLQKKPGKMKMPSGSPAGAKEHNSLQLDAGKTPQKKTVVTPKGIQQKTVHVGQETVAPKLTIPATIAKKPPNNKDHKGTISKIKFLKRYSIPLILKEVRLLLVTLPALFRLRQNLITKPNGITII